MGFLRGGSRCLMVMLRNHDVTHFFFVISEGSMIDNFFLFLFFFIDCIRMGLESSFKIVPRMPSVTDTRELCDLNYTLWK